MSVNFIPLGFLRQQPELEAATVAMRSNPSANLRRANSDPMLSLPPLNKEWSDAQSGRPPAASLLAPAPAQPKDTEMVLVSTLLLDHKITNLEERLKTAMGPWALYGLRYSTLVGIAGAATLKVGLVVLAGALTLSPMVGLGLFLGVLVGSIVVGVMAQTIARHKFNASGKSAAFKEEIAALQADLLQIEHRSGTQTKSLRRLQIMAADVEGGIKQSVWSIFYGITGFDPELARMMRKAHDAPLQPLPVATKKTKSKNPFTKVFAAKSFSRTSAVPVAAAVEPAPIMTPA